MRGQNGGRWKDMATAYRTLGVVFGGLVTSPLYVYPSMNLKSPTEQDYLGIYGIMFWTLTLIGVVKYVCIALNADDHGEGNMIRFLPLHWNTRMVIWFSLLLFVCLVGIQL